MKADVLAHHAGDLWIPSERRHPIRQRELAHY